MPRRHRIDCPHERRPGMAVCLHCLHAARVAARERRQRLLIRFSLWALGLAVVGAVGAAGAGAVVRHPSAQPPVRTTSSRVAAAAPKSEAPTAVAAMPVIPQGAPVIAEAVSTDSATTRPAVASPVAPDTQRPAASTPTFGPVLPQGRTDMADSLFAERRGDTVVVHFDTPPARTRRADKFERIVRETLRTVYGAVADTLLAAVPEGRLAAPNDLLTVLPARGIHLATSSGHRVALWPETRPGRDGPLVVAYRTVVER